MKKTKLYIMISMILVLLLSFHGEKGQMIEDLEVPVGMGNDLEGASNNGIYRTSILSYSFEGDKITNNVSVSKGTTIAQTRQNRQLLIGKKSIFGLNRLMVISEKGARYGIKGSLDIWFNDPVFNDRAICVICMGKAEDILKYQVKGYKSSTEFIAGMVKNLKEYNFFSAQYTIMDMIVRADAEGRNIVLPYIEITPEGIKTTGLAIFKKYKMIGKASMDEAKIINILRENSVNGMLTIQKASKEYIDCYAKSKKKVKCDKEGNKYKFTIDLDLKGELISNELYKEIFSDSKELKKFEKDMASGVEKVCNDSVKKIKCEYKTDVLDLGRVAAAKYGRGSGVDWNEVVCNSDIKINVKFAVDNEGRGEY